MGEVARNGECGFRDNVAGTRAAPLLAGWEEEQVRPKAGLGREGGVGKEVAKLAP